MYLQFSGRRHHHDRNTFLEGVRFEFPFLFAVSRSPGNAVCRLVVLSSLSSEVRRYRGDIWYRIQKCTFLIHRCSYHASSCLLSLCLLEPARLRTAMVL